MALINCPECKKEVSNSALSCPHCGFQLIEKKEPKAKPQLKNPKKKNSGCIIWLIVIAILIIILYNYESSGDSSSSSGSSSSNKFLAYNYAEDFVKKNLKSPSTADFPGTYEKDEHITDLGGGKYKIKSWVDSQNGFGATIRTKFSCTMIFIGDKVRCEDLKFNE